MKNKKIFVGLIYYVTLIYLEIVFRASCTEKLFPITFLHTILYLLPISIFLTALTSIFKDKVNGVLYKIIIFLLGVWYSITLVFKRKFGVFFSLTSVGLADQLKTFFKDTLTTIFNNIPFIILLFIPFILVIIFRKHIHHPKLGLKKYLILFAIFIASYLIFMSSLLIGKNDSYSVYNLFYKIDNHSLTVEKLGVMPSTILEIRKIVFGFEEELSDLIYIEEEEKPTGPIPVSYNTLDIDFEAKSASTKDKTIISMNEYFGSQVGTKKNEYTGLYEGKNLIVFMAESFNSIAVSKELTPTLYKLTHESFVFENFYSPVILSTIGGEFQELTGLYPNLGLLTNVWRKATNEYPYGFGNVFNNLGYNTFAYHDNQYNFQARDKYLKSIGFYNYQGCPYKADPKTPIGLGDKMNCNQWPESDVEMINATVGDYLTSDKPFMTYYATVSGHMAYSWGNAMSRKHKDAVKDLPYSEEVKAYIATQIELDQALETLINKLTEAGKLDDTVIALVADHYPYDLSVDQVNEASSYTRDSVIEINRSNFILWNSQTQTKTITKIGSQIDVLPTLLNLFGVSYDSRLIIGKDILSDTEGLAIFNNNSWVSDLGKYYANSGKFVPFDGVEVPEDYVSTMNKKVQTKILMSKYILEKNYYKYIFE